MEHCCGVDHCCEMEHCFRWIIVVEWIIVVDGALLWNDTDGGKTEVVAGENLVTVPLIVHVW
jgi:hypothetical protein